MTRRLEEQTGALVSANDQLDRRRAFIEAVMSGVTAGVISVDPDGSDPPDQQLGRRAAARDRRPGPVGQTLADSRARARARCSTSDDREASSRSASGGELRTLAVKIDARATAGGAHLRRHHPAIARPAPRRLVRRRAAHRARDQEPADADPARRRAAAAPLSASRSTTDRDTFDAADRHDHPPGRRHRPDGRRILVLRAHAQAGVPREEIRSISPARRCSCTKSRIPQIRFSFDAPEPIATVWSATAARSARR